jgi:hypothetical protein
MRLQRRSLVPVSGADRGLASYYLNGEEPPATFRGEILGFTAEAKLSDVTTIRCHCTWWLDSQGQVSHGKIVAPEGLITLVHGGSVYKAIGVSGSV